MKNRIVFGTVAAAVLSAGLAGPVQAENFRIGFLNTLSGGAAILGKAQLAGWNLGLEMEGWKKNGDKLGGVPTDVFIGDDQRKVDVGLRVVRKWLKSERVHMVAGVIWSNILAAVQRPVIRSRRAMMSTNAGWSGMAGKNCSPYYISTSFQNDEAAEAMGQLMNDEGLKKVFMMAPNYQAGKDMLTGFRRAYKDGEIVGQIPVQAGCARLSGGDQQGGRQRCGRAVHLRARRYGHRLHEAVGGRRCRPEGEALYQLCRRLHHHQADRQGGGGLVPHAALGPEPGKSAQCRVHQGIPGEIQADAGHVRPPSL